MGKRLHPDVSAGAQGVWPSGGESMFPLLPRAVGSDHFCDTTRASQSPKNEGIPLYHRSGEKTLHPTTLLLPGKKWLFKAFGVRSV